MTLNPIRSNEWALKVCEALGVDAGDVSEIVVVARAEQPLEVEIKRYGNYKFLDIEFPNANDVDIVKTDEREPVAN